jgi:predicted HicB family RNase H-like nuclease
MSDEPYKACVTYTDFKDLITARYKKKHTTRFYRKRLAGLQRKGTESIEKFSDRIKAINVHTYELTNYAAKNTVIRYEAGQRALDTF